MNRPISSVKLLFWIVSMIVLCIVGVQILNHVKPAVAQVNVDEAVPRAGQLAASPADPAPWQWGRNCVNGSWCFTVHRIKGTNVVIAVAEGAYTIQPMLYGDKP